MKVEVLVKIYNDAGVELSVGDAVKVVTNSGTYEGTIKRILPKSFSVALKGGSGVQITYKDILNIM